MKRKGMRLIIYRSNMGDCSNGGISARCNEVTLVGEGIPEIFEESEKAPAVEIDRKVVGGEVYLYARPVGKPSDTKEYAGPMFGGCYIASCDSRVTKISQYPIPLHDRFETWEQYERLSR